MQGGRFMNPVIDKIYWETNSRVKSSNLINPSKIVPKSSTDKFPCEAITIRLRNMNSKDINGTAYFHGKAKLGHSWGGQNYYYPDGKLMVSVFNGKDGIVFNGNINTKNYSMQDITDAINYCRDIISKL